MTEIGAALADVLRSHSATFPTEISARCRCGHWSTYLTPDVDWHEGFWEHIADDIVVKMLAFGYRPPE
jgi:hypothetical protein